MMEFIRVMYAIRFTDLSNFLVFLRTLLLFIEQHLYRTLNVIAVLSALILDVSFDHHMYLQI